MRFTVGYIIMAETISNYFYEMNDFRAHIAFVYKVMHNKFRNVIEFMSQFICPLSIQKSFQLNIFFASSICKLVQFTALASTNIPSKRELFITSANF